jgi:hypothetical protein
MAGRLDIGLRRSAAALDVELTATLDALCADEEIADRDGRLSRRLGLNNDLLAVIEGDAEAVEDSQAKHVLVTKNGDGSWQWRKPDDLDGPKVDRRINNTAIAEFPVDACAGYGQTIIRPHLHTRFARSDTLLGRSRRAARMAELRAFFQDVHQQVPTAERVQGNSWEGIRAGLVRRGRALILQ